MNLTWHIVKKDFRRRWPLVAGLVVAQLGYAILLVMAQAIAGPKLAPDWLNYLLKVIESTMDDPQKIAVYTEASAFILVFAHYVLLLLLTYAVLTEDTPLGDRAFWLSRPVSGGRMFAAKAIFLGLLIVPLQVALYVGLHLSVYLISNDWLIGFHAILFQTLWAATIVISTVLWRSMPIGFGFFMLVVFVNATWLYRHSDFGDMAFCFAWPLLAVLILWWMYTHRNRLVGFALLASGLIALYLARYFP